MLGERREFSHWPRTRRRRKGGVVITGWALTAGRYLLVVRAISVVLMMLAYVLVASATQGFWYQIVPEGTRWYAWSTDLAGIRLSLARLANAYPEVASALFYNPGLPLDVHLLLIVVALVNLRRFLAMTIALVVTTPTRFRITVTDRLVRCRTGLFRWRVFRRNSIDAPVTARAVGPESWGAAGRAKKLTEWSFGGEGSQPPGILEIARGMRRKKILFALRGDRAEAIAARCNEALRETAELTRGRA